MYNDATDVERLDLGCPIDLFNYVDTSPNQCTLVPALPFSLSDGAELIDDVFVKFSIGVGLVIAFCLNVGIVFLSSILFDRLRCMRTIRTLPSNPTTWEKVRLPLEYDNHESAAPPPTPAHSIHFQFAHSTAVPAAQAFMLFIVKMQQDCVLMLLTNFTANVSFMCDIVLG